MYDELIEKERELFIEEGYKYGRLVSLARKVHQPTIVPLWNLKVTSADGTVRVDRNSYGHSWTRNLYNSHAQFSLFRRQLAHNAPVPNTYEAGGLGLKNATGGIITSGFRQTLFPEPHVFGGGYGVPAGSLSYGFQAGTGTTPESFEDFVVEGLIPHGVGGGQLSYATASLVKGWDAGDRFKYARWTRVLTNSSGGPITIGNVAMCFLVGALTSYCYVHEVLSPSQGLAHTEILTFTYEFRMYFP